MDFFFCLKRHSDNDCQQKLLTCRFTGCTVQFKRHFQTEHHSSCNEREMNCRYCDEVIKHYDEQVSYDFFNPLTAKNEISLPGNSTFFMDLDTEMGK